MNQEIIEKFGNRVRVRVCGICRKDNKLLLVNHKSLTTNNFWIPPGGGIELGQSIEQSLMQEFEQETGLLIEPAKFLFGCEFIKAPMHAVELFFEVYVVGGELKVGIDPELSHHEQIISEVAFLSVEDIDAIPLDQKHGIFKHCQKAKHLNHLNGFYTI
jgi:8-oxo-dGTP diphosphatase